MGRVQDQKAFGAYFAAATGLSPAIVGKWLAAEQGPGSAATAGSNNWLNIQYTGSGPNATYYRIAHMSPRDAAYASAKWLKEQSGLRGILRAAGKGVQAEARAIEDSGWAESHYNGQLASYHGYSLPKVQGGRLPGGEGGGGTRTVPGQLSVVGGESGGSGAAIAAAIAALAKQNAAAPAPVGQIARPSFAAGPPIPGVAAAPAPQQDASLATLLAAARSEGAGTLPHIESSGPQTIQGHGAPSRVREDESLKGLVKYDGHLVAAWIAPILRYVEGQGVKPEVESGYRSEAEQARIYASGVRPAAPPGHSKHELKAFPGGAVDLRNPQAVAKVLAHSPYRNVLVWAGSKDTPHFSHPVNGTY